jgi:FtsH-binding integral membrane protein
MPRYTGDASRMAVDTLGVSSRAEFLAKTYYHLFGAICGFTLLEIWLFQSGYAQVLAQVLLGTNWLLVLGGFMVVSWLASRAAFTSESMSVQYLALAGFVVAEAIIFVPLLYVANIYAPGTIKSAATMTLIGFTGLTVVAMSVRTDFSFLGGMLRWGAVVALMLIAGAVLFGMQLGTWFSVAMIGFAGAAILYDTQTVLRHFPEDRYVGAALQLFASVALMFWYVLQLLMGSRR